MVPLDVLYGAFKDTMASFSWPEKLKLFSGNAVAVYRI
jgi:hypothetical protein